MLVSSNFIGGLALTTFITIPCISGIGASLKPANMPGPSPTGGGQSEISGVGVSVGGIGVLVGFGVNWTRVFTGIGVGSELDEILHAHPITRNIRVIGLTSEYFLSIKHLR